MYSTGVLRADSAGSRHDISRRTSMISRFSTMFCAIAATVVAALPAAARDTVKIAYIDPLSGGMASLGEVGLKTFTYLAEVTNAHGGIAGEKLEVVGYDNKLNAQETLVQLQKA